MSLPYTVAILTDIHGNLAALDAVLTGLAEQPYDTAIIAGDLLVNGPQPAATLARIRELDAHVIYGNMDEAIVHATPDDLVVWWARQQIGAGGVDYLAALPFCQRVTPPDGATPGDDLLAVHASPRNVHDVLILHPEPEGTTFTVATAQEEAAAMIGDTRAGLIVYGHIHYFSEGVIGGQRISSIGSVGFPFDRDQRAAYALAQWDGTCWQIHQRRVSYNYERVADAIRRSGQPLAERYAQMILQAKWLPRNQFA